MKTKYEKFLEHLIHGIDEPKRTFYWNNKIGYTKDKFALKGQLLSATKVFLSNDFVHKEYMKYCESHPKAYRQKTKNIDKYHKEIFSNSLPLYDNMLILFPYMYDEEEFMAGCWIRKISLSKDFVGVPTRKIKDFSQIYRISTFDNACKLVGYPERLNLSMVDYIVDFNGGIGEELEQFKTTGKNAFMDMFFNNFKEDVKKSYQKFFEFLPSFINPKQVEKDAVARTFASIETAQSHIGICVYLNLLQFINSKGSETIAFKSSLPIKKRSNIQKGFEYKMLEVKKANRITTRYGDSINKNRLHWVRRHTREYKNGKTIIIHPHQRGDEKMGVIIKDYNFK